MGQEAEEAGRRSAFRGFTVDPLVMAQAAPGAVFLHCLPAHRGEEVTGDVIDGPQSLVWPQAANRMHAFRGLLLSLFGSVL
jgi:ornithine carbamoyltransferase